MKQLIDFDATIKEFFRDAISWLEKRPVHLRNGVDYEKIACEYMNKVALNPRKYTAQNMIYENVHKLEGFIEYSVDGCGNLIVNNDLYFAVINALNSIGKYYEINFAYSQMELMLSIKDFKIALNRKNVLKTVFYTMQKPYYFMQKQK